MLDWNLGERIQNMRKHKGLSQKQLADRVHVTSTTISHWENDTQTPSIVAIRNVAITLNCSLDYLMGIDDQPTIKFGDLSDRERKFWYEAINLYVDKKSRKY